MHFEEGGYGFPQTPAALSLVVEAAGLPAAAKPQVSGQSCAATGPGAKDPQGFLAWTHSSPSVLKVHLVEATGVQVLWDPIPNSQR